LGTDNPAVELAIDAAGPGAADDRLAVYRTLSGGPFPHPNVETDNAVRLFQAQLGPNERGR
jgi:hypothetical protein